MVKGASPRLNTPNNLSAYEKKRLATIDANRKVLEELGLLDDVQAMRNSMKKAPACKRLPNRTSTSPLFRAARRRPLPEIRAEKQREKEAEARRKAIEEAAAEERRGT